jgi:hypothetical protein
VPLCPPQTPHGLSRDRTRSCVVGGRRLTAWAMARPVYLFTLVAGDASVCSTRLHIWSMFPYNAVLWSCCTVSGRKVSERNQQVVCTLVGVDKVMYL